MKSQPIFFLRKKKKFKALNHFSHSLCPGGPRQGPSPFPEGHWEEEIYQPATNSRQGPRLGQTAYTVSWA